MIAVVRRCARVAIVSGIGVSASACDLVKHGSVAAEGLSLDSIPVVREAFQLPLDVSAELDSPTVWHGPDGQHWLLITAKEANAVLINDAATGAALGRVGQPGTGPGQFAYPNGIAVLDDILLVVERDNHRVQVLTLPDLVSVGSFGSDELLRPYGIGWHAIGGGRYEVYITDNYETGDAEVPPNAELGMRVRRFAVWVDGTTVRAELRESFGDTAGAGVLREVESIVADSAHQRLLVADEGNGFSYYKVYDLEGEFTGNSMGRGIFAQEAEGLALYACDGGDGYWIGTDQGEQMNAFHVFDRESFSYVGSFRGSRTHSTDGVVLTQRAFGPFPAGAFFASHADGSMSAFSWAEVASVLGLRSDCVV